MSDTLPYDRFRLGLTFRDVRRLLAQEAEDRFWATGERMFVTRRTVLGRMHQLKRESYEGYSRNFTTEENEPCHRSSTGPGGPIVRSADPLDCLLSW
jgi:hypothetical protein